jgi:hypothetical protein
METTAKASPPAAPSTEERTLSLAQSLLSESHDNPNAWAEEKPEGEPEAETPDADASDASEAPSESEEQPAAEEATPAEEMEEIEYGEGKKYKVPLELKRGWLREDDYTRKTQKLGEGFRTVDATLSQLTQTAQVLQAVAPKIGELRNLDSQIQQYRAAMTPQLRQQDPVEFGAYGAQLQLLHSQREQIAHELSGEESKVVHALDQARQQTIRARMEAEMPILQATIKDFNPEKHGKEVSEYLRKSRIAEEAQSFINHSPAALALVWKARQYDQLQADKKTSLKKVEQLPPVAKPGQRTSQAEGDLHLKKLRAANAKAGGKDPEVRRALLKEQLFGRR